MAGKKAGSLVRALTNLFQFSPGLVGSARGVSLARILFGGLALHRMLVTSDPRVYLVDPAAFFVFSLFLLFSLATLLGFFSRAASAATAIALLIIFLFPSPELRTAGWLPLPFRAIGSFGAPTNLFLLVQLLLLLAFTPCGEFYSLDAYRAPRARGATRQHHLWGVQLIRIQICAMYFWTVLEKCNEAYLKGVVFEQVWIMRVAGPFRYFHASAAGHWFAAFSIAVAASELALFFFLVIPASRRFGIVFGSVFHLLSLVVVPVGPFAFEIISSYLLFLDPEQLDAWLLANAGDSGPRGGNR
jgi:hypothetical protein